MRMKRVERRMWTSRGELRRVVMPSSLEVRVRKVGEGMVVVLFSGSETPCAV